MIAISAATGLANKPSVDGFVVQTADHSAIEITSWEYKQYFTLVNYKSCGRFSTKDVLRYDVHEKGILVRKLL